VLLRELGSERAWTTYLENIVHEASHLYLYTLFLADPILHEDGRRQYRSPIRPGGRPLSAVMHAAFVLARTARIVRVLGSRPAYRDDIATMSTTYNAAANPESFERKFVAAWKTLHSEAAFTPFGQELLADCRRIALDED
jgi:HEXXH motif-containing protein